MSIIQLPLTEAIRDILSFKQTIQIIQKFRNSELTPKYFSELNIVWIPQK